MIEKQIPQEFLWVKQPFSHIPMIDYLTIIPIIVIDLKIAGKR